jgi:hypothetical protein
VYISDLRLDDASIKKEKRISVLYTDSISWRATNPANFLGVAESPDGFRHDNDYIADLARAD